jgi:YHS domain-containing protein
LEPGRKGKVRAQGWGEGRPKLCEEEFMAIDPVCGMKVDEIRTEFHTQFAGKKYFFCSEECQTEFENRPDEFATVTAA